MYPMKVKQMDATRLTNVVTLGFRTIPQGRQIKITQRSSFGGELYMTLLSPESAAIVPDMRLTRVFSCEESVYVIVSQPLEVEEESLEPRIMVLRVISQLALGVLSGADFHHVLPAAIVAWAGSDIPAPAEVSATLGTFLEETF